MNRGGGSFSVGPKRIRGRHKLVQIVSRHYVRNGVRGWLIKLQGKGMSYNGRKRYWLRGACEDEDEVRGG